MGAKRDRLARRRRAAGLSQEKLAQLLGVDRSTVVRWEAAETAPQPWLRPRLADALNVTLDELQDLVEQVAGIGPELGGIAGNSADLPCGVDLVAVAALRECVRQLDESYDRSPSSTLLGQAGQVHGRLAVLQERASNGRVRRALLEVEAESATLMAQLVWDASHRRDHRGPSAFLDQAIHAGRQARAPHAQSYATLRKSFIALYGEKDPVKGRALAQEAAEIAQACTPSLTGLSLLHVAEGHAMTGDRKACEHALRLAEAQLERVDDLDPAAGSCTLNEFNRLAGSCYLSLDLPHRAQPLLRATAGALAGKAKSQAIALGNLSISLIRQGELDEAATTLHRAIDAVELTRGGGGLNVVFAAGRQLRPWQAELWAQEVHDRLLALMATI